MYEAGKADRDIVYVLCGRRGGSKASGISLIPGTPLERGASVTSESHYPLGLSRGLLLGSRSSRATKSASYRKVFGTRNGASYPLGGGGEGIEREIDNSRAFLVSRTRAPAYVCRNKWAYNVSDHFSHTEPAGDEENVKKKKGGLGFTFDVFRSNVVRSG